MEITREIFDQQRRPRFGRTNPERMKIEFWEWMIRGDTAEQGEHAGAVMRDGKLKSTYGPYRARDLFKIPLNRDEGPIWTFDRMGVTRTELPDGRVVCIGGEHEDSYDPDFCIYNDVVVLGGPDEIEILGYPEEVFPPTDFHSATLIGDRIVVIGGLRYQDARRSGKTTVYIVELPDFRISELETFGSNPGWIFKHAAELDPNGFVTILGGEIFEVQGEKKRYRRNLEDYALDLASGEWLRLTNRKWRQFSIRYENASLFVLEKCPELEALVPASVKDTLVTSEESYSIKFAFQGITVSLTEKISRIEIVVEGDLRRELCLEMVSEICANTERATGESCVLEEL